MVSGVEVIARTETTLTVNVTKAPGNWDYFRVTCEPNPPSTSKRGTATCTPPDPCVCPDLTAGEKYTVTVVTVRERFNNVLSDIAAEDVTGFTLFIKFMNVQHHLRLI